MSQKDMLGPLMRASVNLSQSQVKLALDVVNRFTGKDGGAWEAYLKSRLRSGLPNQLAQPSAPKSVLKLFSSSVQLDAIGSYDPSVFRTRPGLWLSDEFVSHVGSKARPVNDLPAITLTSGDLVKNAYDKEITADPVMPTNHKFESESEFVAYLEGMIQKQPNGEEGDLLNNGCWNIFYVAGCVVGVSWGSDCRRWGVSAWELGDDRWYAGSRAFGRN